MLVTVHPAASLLRNPAHLKFAVRKGLDSLAEFTHSHGLCSKCKVLINSSKTFSRVRLKGLAILSHYLKIWLDGGADVLMRKTELSIKP